MNSYELLALPYKTAATAITVGKAYIRILKVVTPLANPFFLIQEVQALIGFYRELQASLETWTDDELWPSPEVTNGTF